MTELDLLKANVPTAVEVPPRSTSAFQAVIWCAADDSAWISRYPAHTARGGGRNELYVLHRRAIPYQVRIELSRPVTEVDYQTAIWELLQLVIPERRRSL